MSSLAVPAAKATLWSVVLSVVRFCILFPHDAELCTVGLPVKSVPFCANVPLMTVVVPWAFSPVSLLSANSTFTSVCSPWLSAVTSAPVCEARNCTSFRVTRSFASVVICMLLPAVLWKSMPSTNTSRPWGLLISSSVAGFVLSSGVITVGCAKSCTPCSLYEPRMERALAYRAS